MRVHHPPPHVLHPQNLWYAVLKHGEMLPVVSSGRQERLGKMGLRRTVQPYHRSCEHAQLLLKYSFKSPLVQVATKKMLSAPGGVGKSLMLTRGLWTVRRLWAEISTVSPSAPGPDPEHTTLGWALPPSSVRCSVLCLGTILSHE